MDLKRVFGGGEGGGIKNTMHQYFHSHFKGLIFLFIYYTLCDLIYLVWKNIPLKYVMKLFLCLFVWCRFLAIDVLFARKWKHMAFDENFPLKSPFGYSWSKTRLICCSFAPLHNILKNHTQMNYVIEMCAVQRTPNRYTPEREITHPYFFLWVRRVNTLF